MITRKDIAREAGVSQGTVSNVLNGRGNVSSEKIRLVEAAIEKLGYTMNERARILRKGSSNILGLVLPDILSPQYAWLYNSFKNYAESHGYSTNLYLSDDDPTQELTLIRRLRADMVAGVASVSSLENAYDSYLQSGLSDNAILFVERSPDTSCHYIGFDYAKAGQFFGMQAAAENKTRLAVITGTLSRSNEQAFYQAFTEALRKEQREALCTIQTDRSQCYHHLLQALNSEVPEAFYLSGFSHAETLSKILKHFYGQSAPAIHTVSPLFTMPQEQYDKYELNYSLLGQQAAKLLLKNLFSASQPVKTILPPDGKRSWTPPALLQSKKDMTLHLLLIDAPETFALKSLAQLYTQKTGINISCSIYSYDDIYDLLSRAGKLGDFDILRLDVTSFSWFAEQSLTPLEELDPSIEELLSQYASGIATNYSRLGGHIYALPYSPSVQMLYYRKDLFENVMLQRIYQERYKTPLKLPSTFEEFNRVAAFFTKSCNPDSPVSYGTSLTLGSIGTAASEFMVRYRAYSPRLHGTDGNLDFHEELSCKVLEQLIALKPYTRQPNYRWWTDATAGFANGEEAMSIFYNNYAPGLLNQNSKVGGKIGVTLVPGQNPLLGGAVLGVSRNSAHPREALHFLKWLCSDPVASATALLDGIATCKNTYNNVEIQDTYPWMRSVQKSFIKITEKRPPIQLAKPFNERLFLDIIGQATRAAYLGRLTPAEAIQEAMRRIRREIE